MSSSVCDWDTGSKSYDCINQRGKWYHNYQHSTFSKFLMLIPLVHVPCLDNKINNQAVTDRQTSKKPTVFTPFADVWRVNYPLCTLSQPNGSRNITFVLSTCSCSIFCHLYHVGSRVTHEVDPESSIYSMASVF